MERINFRISALLMGVMILFSTACQVDPPVEPISPTLELSTEAGFVLDTATIPAGTAFQVKLISSRGDSGLQSITVKENGTAIDANRIKLDGFEAASNPSPVSEPNGFSWVVEIIAQTDVDVTNTFTIEVADGNGLNAEVSVDITTFDPGTPVTESTMILLLNQGGPAGQGALDLHTGTGTGTTVNDTIADIRDQGIDINLPADQNWIQKIAPINGSDLRTPDTGFVYDDVKTREDIEGAFNDGTTITESEKVSIGDSFLVFSGGTYFAFTVTDINVTAGDNADYYELSVKQ